MSGKKQTQITTHIPSQLANAMNIKSNNPYNRWVGGEFIATSAQEAHKARSMGYNVASAKKSFDVRWNNGESSDSSHPGYSQMVANQAVNTMMGMNQSQNFCGMIPHGMDTHRRMPQQSFERSLMDQQMSQYTMPPPMRQQSFVDQIPHQQMRPVQVTATRVYETPTVSVVKKDPVPDQDMLDLAEAIAQSLITKKEPVKAPLYHAPPPPAYKVDDPDLDLVIRNSMLCAQESCKHPFGSETAKFCSNCGTRR